MNSLKSLPFIVCLILCVALTVTTLKFRGDYYEAQSTVVELQEKNKVLKQNNIALNSAITIQNQRIAQLAKDSEEYQKQLSEIHTYNQERLEQLETEFDNITVDAGTDLLDWLREQAKEGE